jgi:energy-coupling factor transporter ATP-binding protein EcfA2
VSVAEAPIRVDGLTRHYGKRRGISDLTFEVEEGEFFGFLGPDGAGKTTTIRQHMGLMRPSSGSARIFELGCWHDSVRIDLPAGDEAALVGMARSAGGNLYHAVLGRRVIVARTTRAGRLTGAGPSNAPTKSPAT